MEPKDKKKREVYIIGAGDDDWLKETNPEASAMERQVMADLVEEAKREEAERS